MGSHVLGSAAALISAASWALGMVLWRRIGDTLSPLSINLNKCLIGMAYLGAVFLVVGIKPLDIRTFIVLGLSGLLGIALADTFFFMSLMHLGSRLSSIMGTLSPVLIALSAVILLGERSSIFTWLGIFITVAGVAWVLWERTPKGNIIKNRSLGIRYAMLSLICMTMAVLLAKVGVSSVSAIEATFIRILWASVGLTVWGIYKNDLKGLLMPFKNWQLLRSVLFIVFIGTFGGFWLSLVALKHIDASIAGTLNSTEPLFILPMVAFILKEKITLRAVVGAVVAVAGVSMIFMAG